MLEETDFKYEIFILFIPVNLIGYKKQLRRW